MGRKRKTTEQFITESKIIHGQRWDYSQSEYIYSTKKLKIICVEHGVFEQTPHHHLEGQTCPDCANRTRAGHGNIVNAASKYANERCYFYNIKLTGLNEEFYKYGISKNYVARHKRITRESSYKVEILDIIEDTRYNCSILEDKLLSSKIYQGLQYIPKFKFSGYTECYTLDSSDI